ncbi:ABC transporter substrate-binding protein [Vibrio sp.]|nr:ABC transporter substrate-binding protein [Vibrio sp.]
MKQSKCFKSLLVTMSLSSGLFVSGFANADIELGAILPLTGGSSENGIDQQRGIELAVKELNDKGGVLGEPVKVIFEDSAGNPMTGLGAVKKLVQVNNVPVVIGSFSSSVTIPVGQYLEQQKRIHINISGTSTDIRNIGDYSYSVIGLDNLSSQFSAQDVYDLGYKRAVVIAPNGAYGQGTVKQFSKFFKEAGGKIVGTVLYKMGQPTYRSELDRLSRLKPDVYVYTSYGQDAIVLNRDAYQLGLNQTPWYAKYLTMSTGDSPKEYTNGQRGMEVQSLGPDGKHYVDAYTAEYHKAPQSAYGSFAYDAVMLAAKAIETAKSSDPDKVQAAMQDVAPSYEGITGAFNLDKDHMRTTQPYKRVKIAEGKIELR